MSLLQINLKSYTSNPLKIFSQFFIKLLKKLKLNFSIINTPIKKKRITLIKSPHVYKKAREQFELRIHKKTFFIKNFNNITLINSLLINKPKLINFNIKYIGK
jgi:small subunit ribosomal protein S10